jgi:Lon protease-like protein
MTLHLFEPRYLKLMAERAEIDPIFGVVLTRDGHEVGDQPEIHSIGTAASLVTGTKHDDGRYSIIVQGTRQFRVGAHDWTNDYLMADIQWLPHGEPATASTAELSETARRLFIEYVVALAENLGNERAKRELPAAIDDALITDPDRRAFQIAGHLPLNTWQQQQILELGTASERLHAVVELIRRERALIDITGPATALTTHPTSTFSMN